MGSKRLVCLLLALMLAGCAGCQLAKPEAERAPEQDRLIGVYVTREHLDLFDMERYLADNAAELAEGGAAEVSAQDSETYGGRLWAVRQADGDWVFEGLDGFGYYAYRYENGTAEESLGSHLDEGLVSDGMHLTVTDDGERVELRANLYVTAGAGLTFYCNPVYQTAGGAVYLMSGSGVQTNTGLEGEAASMTLEDTVTVTEDGGSRTDSCRVEVRFECVGTPEAVTFLQMDEESRVLRRERFAPEEVPEELTLEAGCAYVVAETETRGPEGESVVTRQIADAALPGEEPPELESFSVREDGSCLRRVTKIVSP